MRTYTIVYDITDIYDSYYVQKQIPRLSRRSEIKEIHNDLLTKTQMLLKKYTGLTIKPDKWSDCILYFDNKEMLGYMICEKKGSDTVLLRDIFVADDELEKDIFLMMLARAVRKVEIEDRFCNHLHISLQNSKFYYLCLGYLGEGNELLINE